MEDKWNKINTKLPATHEWFSYHAIKVKERGRASGGIIIDKKKNWGTSNIEIENAKSEGIVHIKITENMEKARDDINIVAVYNARHGKDIDVLKKELEGYEYGNIIVEGDFNIRTRSMGGDEEEGGIERKSKDKIIGNRGKKFIQTMKEEGLYGRTKGDWEGEYTYIGAQR